ncbi:MAG TPA: arginine--tRNA ligase [Phycisphaerae bacterium]|nr:arginine--tRNA ligase [Phycisphaerae bacterium]
MQHRSLINILRSRFVSAVAKAAGVEAGEIDPQVRPAQEARFGDYQCNVAMSLAKTLKAKPREIAERIVAELDVADLCEPPEIAGPGFINVRLTDDALSRHLGEIPAPPPESEPGARATGQGQAKPPESTDAARAEARGSSAPAPDRLGMPPVEQPRKVVIDYSSPNIAKQMHVGHLRSTIIGDVFARVLGFEGHEIVRQNHVGDWGTQFGRVILGLWHICMAHKRGRPAYIKEAAAALPKDPKDESSIAAFQRFKKDHDEDYWEDDLGTRDDGKPDGKKYFLPFLKRIHGSSGVSLEELEEAYILVDKLASIAKAHGDDPYAGIAQDITRMLQHMEEQEHLAWQYSKNITLEHCDEIYGRLNVLLEKDDVCGESFYNDRLAPAVVELSEKLKPGSEATSGDGSRVELREDDGAQCVFFYDTKGEPRFKTRDGDELPMIIQKSDGAYLYATTDLAAIKYRTHDIAFPSGDCGATRIIYVTDARQKLHFEMLFAVARAAGWIGEDVDLEHASFGSILGDNKKPLKTREGENVKLSELLDEAEKRAYELLKERDRGIKGSRDQGEETGTILFTEDEKREIARRVGIGAVKYADLARDRNSDYVFNWDQMLALQGNTAPYMMYAYARIRSIYGKAAERFGSPSVYGAGVTLALGEPAERALALRLARLRETIDAVAAELAPHILCSYLYELAAEFMRFYEACPVIQAPDEATRLSRMRLCDLTARALRLGLGLLGIEAVERM